MMQYRKFGKTGTEISAIGFGAMRMPVTADNKIDEPVAISMIRAAIDGGVNYVDTAYMYHDGASESLVGKALKDGYREKTYVATKSPTMFIKEEGDFDRFFAEQMRRLDMEYIDFYLLHAINFDVYENVVKKFGLLSKMEKLKQEGKIRHIGFSFHGPLEDFIKIIDDYDGWEFCQIQLNYIDTNNQAGLSGLAYAAGRGLGVIVMEPLLGGKLADPPAQVKKALLPGKTPVEWALDFLWDKPEVTFMLSGMSTPQQVEDNLIYANKAAAGMLTMQERQMFVKAKEAHDQYALVPCTKCAYCMPCPFGVDIPGVYAAYNMTVSKGMDEAKKAYAAISKTAQACKGCKKCEAICPQSIETASLMPQISRVFS